jgi:acyl carrier protein phosphodiesterase
MAGKSPSIHNNLEHAVDCFRPVLQRLRIRDGASIGVPVFLASFPHLWPLNNIDKWVITVLKTKLVDSKAKFLSQYHKNTGIMECYIILDDVFFVDAKVPNEIRKAVAVHEFCHFLALIYAGASTTEEVLQNRLRERLSKVVDVLTNEQVLKLYQLLNKVRPLADDFSAFEQTKDEHFRLDCEDLDLSYTDLFKNFLLSRRMFDEYFSNEDKVKFFNLLSDGETEEAFDLYINIAKKIAEEKWLPENFAKNQAVDILIKFYLSELK